MPNFAKPLPRASASPSTARQSGPARPASGTSESESTPGATSSALYSVRWWIVAAAAILVVDAAIVVWLRSKGTAPEPSVSNDIVLGTFDFSRSNSRENRAYRGQFDLSIRLADDLSTSDRRRIADQRPELQRAAEEALWRLRPVDFADRRLTRLKSRLQEQLNDAVGFEAIAEVVISNFTLEPRVPATAQPSRDGAAIDLKAGE